MSAIFAAVRRCRPRLLAGWLLSCGLLLLLVAPQAQAATRQVGIDIPVQWYADDSGQMTLESLCRPARRPARHHPADPLLWLFAKNLVAAQRAAGHVVCRGAALAAAGPHFRRPSDHLLPAAGQRWPVDAAHLWRSRRRPRKRSALSGKGADTAPPPTAAGYELVFRLQSTSTLILLASLSSAQVFVQRATADTAFWSFYFGLAAVASGVALWLALALRRRLLWGICLSRSIIRWWPLCTASRSGSRPRRAALPGFYDQ